MKKNTPKNNTRTHTPDEILKRAGLQVPPLLLPKPSSVFAERALRLRELAAGHAMRDYLMLMAVVAEAQHARLQEYPEVALPMPEHAEAARAANQPLVDATSWPRDPVWREEMRAMLRQVLENIPVDSPARGGVQAALDIPDDTLELQAERLLTGITLGLDMATAPLVAAGLQLYWTRLVAAISVKQPGAFHAPEDGTHCPCCGSLPVASITRVRGKMEGQRYLQCSLCSSQWHMMRVKCTHCLSIEDIHYRGLQPVSETELGEQRPSIEAETCNSCKHYLKIVHMDRMPQVEPLADDLATVTLDLLVSEAGYVRQGTNLLLLFGDDTPA